MVTPGDVYKTLLREAEEERPYDGLSKKCIESTVGKLLGTETSADRPGMLLGMIQSGKTKTFLGVIALAIDNGFSLFVILTKGTKALSTQTYERLKETFETSIDDEKLQVFDIMALNKLSGLEQRMPLVLVVKKNKDNLNRLIALLFETYPELGKRKTLLIDDEADYASVGYKRPKSEMVELQKIMGQIDEVRQNLPDHSFLQVTATPYSLYLQPASISNPGGALFKPIRPAFTELVPIHDQYIGGEFYFEASKVEGSVASFLFDPIAPVELEILHHEDRRRFKLSEALTSPAIEGLRKALVNFLVGGIIRRLQDKHEGNKPKRYSFIIHTEAGRSAHAWQEAIIESLVDQLKEAAEAETPTFKKLVRTSYDALGESVKAGELWMPEYSAVLEECEDCLQAIQAEKVNSENDVKALLDKHGQLELRNRLNIFVGGQILDRGLTIGNLIGFYYGRRTQRFQQDTVLQHSRMYGARPMADLAVTRFYTSQDLYNVMETINEFDAGLRNAFEAGGHEAGVVFIHQAGGQIVPCSPNKILVSTLTTLRGGKRLLPVGFQTGYKTNVYQYVEELDELLAELQEGFNQDEAVWVDLPDAKKIVHLIDKVLEDADDSAYRWDVKAFLASMDYVSRALAKGPDKDKIVVLVRKGRDLGRKRRQDEHRFEDAPDTGGIGREYQRIGASTPVLMLFRQEGSKEKGWRGCPFWWPVLYMPQNMGTVVFASDVYDFDEDDQGD